MFKDFEKAFFNLSHDGQLFLLKALYITARDSGAPITSLGETIEKNLMLSPNGKRAIAQMFALKREEIENYGKGN